MIKNLGLLLALLTATAAFGKGGMIGGGDVEFQAVMECDAQALDHTFPGASYVWVVKEVDYGGNFIEDATLRVVTLDQNQEPINYYVTHARDLYESPQYRWGVDIWRYDVGSTGNKKIGRFEWDEKGASGTLNSTGARNEVEEVTLRNCVRK